MESTNYPLPDCVKGSLADYQKFNSKPHKFESSLGVVAAGPFVVEPTDANPDSFIAETLRFIDNSRHPRQIVIGDFGRDHSLDVIGRVRIEDGKIKANTKDWGMVTIRQLSLKDKNLVSPANLLDGKNPKTVQEFAEILAPEDRYKW